MQEGVIVELLRKRNIALVGWKEKMLAPWRKVACILGQNYRTVERFLQIVRKSLSSDPARIHIEVPKNVELFVCLYKIIDLLQEVGINAHADSNRRTFIVDPVTDTFRSFFEGWWLEQYIVSVATEATKHWPRKPEMIIGSQLEKQVGEETLRAEVDLLLGTREYLCVIESKSGRAKDLEEQIIKLRKILGGKKSRKRTSWIAVIPEISLDRIKLLKNNLNCCAIKIGDLNAKWLREKLQRALPQ